MAFPIALATLFAAAQMQAVTVPAQPLRQPAAPPHVAAGPNEDSPEEIAKDSARDLKDSRFYNKPGATRAQYDADWQECRLIARGSKTPRTRMSPLGPTIHSVTPPVGLATASALPVSRSILTRRG